MPKGIYSRASVAERMERFVTPEPNTGCWLWTGRTWGSNGYGQFWFNGRNHNAHRIAWLLLRGPIPGDLFVLHACDVPRCVNPAHLFLGTQADNVADAIAKKRFFIPRNLTSADAMMMHKNYAQGVRPHTIAAVYGITERRVRALLGLETDE